MAMSTVEVRPHGVRLTGHERAAIIPSHSTQSGGTSQTPRLTSRAEPTSAYSVSNILLSQGQQHATSVQIASRALQQVGQQLTTIKRGLSQALNQPGQPKASLQQELTQGKARVETILQQARYDGQRLIDNELKLNLSQQDTRRFAIPGLNIHRLSDRAEQVRLDFPQGGSVMLQFDGQADGQKTVKMLDRNLIALGMRASLADDGTILFQVAEDSYRQMQQQVRVTGQGHRFPAGQANVVSIESRPDGIAELNFDLSSRNGIKQSIAKVNQHLHQTQQSLQDARLLHGELTSQVNRYSVPSQSLSATELDTRLAQVNRPQPGFSHSLQAISAQANVRRHTVVALLK